MRSLLARYAYARRTLGTRCEDVRSIQLNSYVGEVVRTISFAIRYSYAELIRCSLTAPLHCYVDLHILSLLSFSFCSINVTRPKICKKEVFVFIV